MAAHIWIIALIVWCIVAFPLGLIVGAAIQTGDDRATPAPPPVPRQQRRRHRADARELAR